MALTQVERDALEAQIATAQQTIAEQSRIVADLQARLTFDAMGDLLEIDTLAGQQAVANLVRPQIRFAIDEHEDNLRKRVLSDPTVADWYNITLVWPPLPAEEPAP